MTWEPLLRGRFERTPDSEVTKGSITRVSAFDLLF